MHWREQLHVYDRDHEDTHNVYRGLRCLLEKYTLVDPHHPRLLVGEVPIFDWRKWVTYYGVNRDELHMPFNFGLLGAIDNAGNVRQMVNTIEHVLPPDAWPSYVLGSHDEPRIATRVGRDQARVAMMLLLTLRGTPVVYYGDEIGMTDVQIPADRVHDPWERQVHGKGLGRDPERTPMQWDESLNAGFCAPFARPWLPLPEDAEQFNVAGQLEHVGSMLTLTRRLLHVRRHTAALQHGTYRPFDSAPDGCFIYFREIGEETWSIALNFTSREYCIPIIEDRRGLLILSTALDRDGVVDLSAFVLRANEGCLIQLSGGSCSHLPETTES